MAACDGGAAGKTAALPAALAAADAMREKGRNFGDQQTRRERKEK
jgi:hypothetical protein